MEKHPITSTFIIAIVAAFLGELGSRGLDAMSSFVINKGWCEANNGKCLFLFQVFVLILFVAIAFVGDSIINNQSNWSKVKILRWHPASIDVYYGITIQNNSWVDINDCTCELTGYEDDRMVKLNMASFGFFLKQRGDLPRRLLWKIDGKPEDTIKIGRGKEAHLMVCFPLEKSDVVAVGNEIHFKVITNGLSLIDPFEEGWLHLRISGQVNNSPLPLRKIAVRVMIENKVPVIKEIREESKWNFSFKKIHFV